MLERPDIADDTLCSCLNEHYGLSVESLEFLPLGLDLNAGLFRVVAAGAPAYLLKVKSGPIYPPSYLVPRFLRDCGSDAVVAPLPTTDAALWVDLNGWTAILYPFVEGEARFSHPMSPDQWMALGSAVRQIQRIELPQDLVRLMRSETFDPSSYARRILEFETTHLRATSGGRAERAIRASWRRHHSTIHAGMTTMAILGAALRHESGPLVICHADLHPGNIIRNQSGQVFVIDWEDVMLAPRERDLLFVGDPADASGKPGSAPNPFFASYGDTAIDWAALSYYRWERLIQDVIEYAHQGIADERMSAQLKADAVQGFRTVLADGDEADLARATADHLPAALKAQVEAALG